MEPLRPGRSLHRDGTQELLELVGLAPEALETAGELSYGKQKQLELAIALASQPRLLLLDGRRPACRRRNGETIASVRDIVKARGLTLLFTEHDIRWCSASPSASRCCITARSSPRARPTAVRNDPEVKRVYLGEHAHG